MNRSLVRRSTTLACIALLTLLLASPAQATPWDVTTKSWLVAARWMETVRGWFAGGAPRTEPAKPMGVAPVKRTESGSGGKGVSTPPRPQDGMCIGPDGNRIPCV
jgi:hypothetical protein